MVIHSLTSVKLDFAFPILFRKNIKTNRVLAKSKPISQLTLGRNRRWYCRLLILKEDNMTDVELVDREYALNHNQI